MAEQLTQYTDAAVLPRENLYAARDMLEVQAPEIVLDICADVKPMPRNRTAKVSFRRRVTFDAVTTPLVEGVTPGITPFRFENVEGELRQYGQVVGFTDHIEVLHTDPVVKEMGEEVSANVRRTNEQLMWGVLRAGTNVFYANGSSRNAVNTKFSLNLQRNVTMALREQKAMFVTKIVKGSVLIGTQPVEAGYVAFAHTNLEHDIRSVASFVPVSEYGQSMKPISPYELGAIERVRYILSADLDPWVSAGGTVAAGTFRSGHSAGTTADVYPILYCGQHAYGTVPLRGIDSLEASIVPTTPSKSDPIGQRGYVGSKWWHLTVRLNELWMARAEVAASIPS